MPYRRKHKNLRKKAPGRRRKHRKYAKGMNKNQTLIVKSPGVVCPDRTFVKMRYLETVTQILGTAGTSIGSISWAVNSVHALTPIGVTAMSALYRYYRVHGAKVTVSGVNMEAFPINVMLIPLNTTTGVTLAYIQELTQNAFARVKQVSPKGGMDKVVLTSYINSKKLIGSKTVDYDDNYSALSTASPNNLWYYLLAVYPTYSVDTFSASTGFHFEARITMYVEWYERNYLTN